MKNHYHFNKNDIDEFDSQDPDVRRDVQEALEKIFYMLYIELDAKSSSTDNAAARAASTNKTGVNAISNPYIVVMKH